MFKFSFLAFLLLFSFDVNAIVKQSASKALSYKNIVSNTYSSRASASNIENRIAPKKSDAPLVIPPMVEKIDMRYASSKTVSMNKGDFVEITLKEEKGFRWDLNPDSSCMSLSSDNPISDVRILRYKLTCSKDSYIYFDLVDSSNPEKISTTKQLTVNLR